MLSFPPITITFVSPSWTARAAMIAVVRPEPQTLFMVVAPIEFRMPAPMALPRAGAWPNLAFSRHPIWASAT